MIKKKRKTLWNGPFSKALFIAKTINAQIVLTIEYLKLNEDYGSAGLNGHLDIT